MLIPHTFIHSPGAATARSRGLHSHAPPTIVSETLQRYTKSYDILVPICNAYEWVDRCLQSLLKHTPPNAHIWLLDDASTDARMGQLYRQLSQRPQVTILCSPKRQGFVRTMNRGFEATRRDAVILNSDTEVTPRWLEKLHQCRQSDPKIGVVSPLSNNAVFLSLPVSNRNNQLDVSVEEIAAHIDAVSPEYPEIPTGVGFCMLMTREALGRVGYFDRAFGMGYGEEHDFSMRAVTHGFRIACCDNLFIFHAGARSFSEAPPEYNRRERNARLCQLFWPQYTSRIREFEARDPFARIRRELPSRFFSPGPLPQETPTRSDANK